MGDVQQNLLLIDSDELQTVAIAVCESCLTHMQAMASVRMMYEDGESHRKDGLRRKTRRPRPSRTDGVREKDRDEDSPLR